MHTGMLWFSNEKDLTLTQKIQKVVDYYHKKYGRTPDLVLVNPATVDDSLESEKDKGLVAKLENFTTIQVRPYRPVLPGHIWIGIEDKP